MRVGTKSVLFGAHQFAIHPWFVAAAWWALYGFPLDLRLWVAFFVHDIGYFGKPNMDGPEGERHVEAGARIMHQLFDRPCDRRFCKGGLTCKAYWKWHDFSLYHSRFYAKRDGREFSRLCVADKLAICLTPAWLYLPMARATGEIREYMKHADDGKYSTMNIPTNRQRDWYVGVQDYLRRWVAEHRDGRSDTWTPGQKMAQDSRGVWR